MGLHGLVWFKSKLSWYFLTLRFKSESKRIKLFLKKGIYWIKGYWRIKRELKKDIYFLGRILRFFWGESGRKYFVLMKKHYSNRFLVSGLIFRIFFLVNLISKKLKRNLSLKFSIFKINYDLIMKRIFLKERDFKSSFFIILNHIENNMYRKNLFFTFRKIKWRTMHIQS